MAVQINPHYQNEVVAAQGTLQAAVQDPYASLLSAATTYGTRNDGDIDGFDDSESDVDSDIDI